MMKELGAEDDRIAPEEELKEKRSSTVYL